MLPAATNPRLLLAVVLALATLLAPGLTTTARAAATGTLQGRIVEASGAGLAAGRGQVELYDVAGGLIDGPVEIVQTQGDGSWSATVPAGDYRVHVSDNDAIVPGAWVGGDTWDAATTFTVVDGATTTMPTTTLRPGPSVAGTVRDAAGRPVQHATVDLTSDEGLVGLARSTRSGGYRFDNVWPGAHTVEVHDEFGDYLGTSRAVVVGSSDVRLDVTLTEAPAVDEPSRLSGLVVDTAGAPVRAAYVTAYRRTEAGAWLPAQSTYTNRSGRYAFADLAPGSYTLRVVDEASEDDERFEDQWYLGRRTERTATTIVVPVDGTVTAPAMTVEHAGAISGRVTRPASTRPDDRWAYVHAFDADGRQVAEARVGTDGAYRFGGLRPGDYTLRASGTQWMSVAGEEHQVDLVAQWWRNAYHPGTATRLRLASGGDVTGVDLTLSAALANVTRPTAAGTGALGTRLTASPGAWNRMASTELAHQWTRNGTPIAGATSATYVTTVADLGRSVAVRVTASDRDDLLASASAVSAATVVRGAAAVSVRATGAKRAAAVRVTLGLQGIAARSTTGTVRVHDGRRLVRTLAIRSGSGAVTLRRLTRGTHTLRVTFAGSGTHRAASASVRVRVR